MKKKEISSELTSKGSAEGTLLLQQNANHSAPDMEREATGEIILYQPDSQQDRFKGMIGDLEYELIEISCMLSYEIQLLETGISVHEEDSVSSLDNTSIEEIDENGIPMGTSLPEIKKRQQLIYKFYEAWKADHPDKAVFNENLQAEIHIRQESVVEAVAHASKRYKSTLAVLRLDEVLAKAIQVGVDKPKSGNKNQRKLIRMILMAYECEGIGNIKLTVGVRNRTLDKIQYGITAQNGGEIARPSVCRKTKKTPHKK